MTFNLFTYLAYIVIGISITHANYLEQSPILTQASTLCPAIESAGADIHNGDVKAIPRPCCLPYRFQAVTTNLLTFSAKTKEVFMLYRDWEKKIQIQEIVIFNNQGIERSVRKTFMDFKNMVQYVITPDTSCQRMLLDFGMLEPCMPENATYLGKSYIGAHRETTHFNAWNFQRTNLNRNIEITISVTPECCMPVSERVTGQIAGGSMDILVLFTNVTEDVADSVFDVPFQCLDLQSM